MVNVNICRAQQKDLPNSVIMHAKSLGVQRGQCKPCSPIEFEEKSFTCKNHFISGIVTVTRK